MGEYQLGEFDVLVGTVVAGTGHDFGALHGPAKVGDFLGPFIHQQYNDTALGGTMANRMDSMFQENGLSRLGRRDNQLTRTLAYRCDEVYYAHTLLTAIAQVKSLVRIDRHQVSKSWTFAEILRSHSPYGFNGH
jgi:hypothetical protein